MECSSDLESDEVFLIESWQTCLVESICAVHQLSTQSGSKFFEFLDRLRGHEKCIGRPYMYNVSSPTLLVRPPQSNTRQLTNSKDSGMFSTAFAAQPCQLLNSLMELSHHLNHRHHHQMCQNQFQKEYLLPLHPLEDQDRKHLNA